MLPSSWLYISLLPLLLSLIHSMCPNHHNVSLFWSLCPFSSHTVDGSRYFSHINVLFLKVVLYLTFLEILWWKIKQNASVFHGLKYNGFEDLNTIIEIVFVVSATIWIQIISLPIAKQSFTHLKTSVAESLAPRFLWCETEVSVPISEVLRSIESIWPN